MRFLPAWLCSFANVAQDPLRGLQLRIDVGICIAELRDEIANRTFQALKMSGGEWPQLNRLLQVESVAAEREPQMEEFYILMLEEDDVWRVPCPATRALLGVLRGLGMTPRQLHDLNRMREFRNQEAHYPIETSKLAALNDMYESTFKPQTGIVQVALRALEICRSENN